MNLELNNKTISIAGLGYAGLPLALAFSGHLKTIGFDVDGVIVTAAHDEFWGWGFRACRSLWGGRVR